MEATAVSASPDAGGDVSSPLGKYRNVVALVFGAAAVVGLVAHFCAPDGGVEVSVRARRGVDGALWSGTMPAPRIEDGAVFRQRIINNYDSPPLPFPHRVPPYRVTFRMTVAADRAGEYHLELDAPDWEGTLALGGVRLFGSEAFQPPGDLRAGRVRLQPGPHEVVLTVQPKKEATGAIGLLWKPPGENLRRVVARDVLPVSGTPYSWPRIASALRGTTGVATFVAIFCAIAWSLTFTDRLSRRERWAIVGILFVVALVTRAVHFDSYPRSNNDEYHNAWVGFNLLDQGRPKSWSWLPGQEKDSIEWFGYNYPIVDTAFDHPPLLPISVGVTATLLGAKSMFDCRLPLIRPLMVLAGSLSVLLTFFLGSQLLGERVGLLASGIMAASPLSVFNHRLVKEDNFVQLFILAALLVFAWNKDRHKWADVAAGVLSGLATLSKMMGISVAFALAAMAFMENPKDWKRIVRIFVPALLVASLYPLYGFLIDFESFIRTFTHLSIAYPHEALADKARILGRLLLEPKIVATEPFMDGWVLFGWISLFAIRRQQKLLVPFILYALILFVTVRADSLWGFYAIPLYPFLFIAAAAHFERMFQRQELLSIFLFIALCFLPAVAASDALSLFGRLPFRFFAALVFLPLIPAALGASGGLRLRAWNGLMLLLLVSAAFFASLERCLSTT